MEDICRLSPNKKQHKLKVNHMKTILLVGIMAGVATVSAKAQDGGGCDGPVLVAGSTVNTCDCDNTTQGCTGSTTVRNGYYHCGGSGFTYCFQSDDTIGYSNMPCTETHDTDKLWLLQEAYDDCQRDKDKYDPPRTCPPIQYCDWNTCSAGTTGGTAITAQVIDNLGDENGCDNIAQLQKFPSKSVVELAQVSSASAR